MSDRLIRPTEPISSALFAQAELDKHPRDAVIRMSGFLTNIFLMKDDVHYGGGALIEDVREIESGLFVVHYEVNRFGENRSVSSNIDYSGNLVDRTQIGRPVFFSDTGISDSDYALNALLGLTITEQESV